MKHKKLPLVAIVGRVNVGKSSLLNRLIKKRTAIVHETPGVTRDRIYETCDWRGREFILIDTGGIAFDEKGPYSVRIKKQAQAAITESDVILFVTDAKTGILREDEELSRILRRAGKSVILVVNKVESTADESQASEFFKLGFEKLFQISALHGTGTGDLLDEVVNLLPHITEVPEEEYEACLSIVGRPNVGKSSLLNALLKEERSLVSEIPGTTRDSVDSEFIYQGRKYLMIDTAGIRRKGTQEDPLAYYSFLRALKSVEISDLSLLLIDASEGITRQDQRLAQLIGEKGNACIVVVNKWDLVSGDEQKALLGRSIEKNLRFLWHVPFINISAKTGKNIHRIFPLVEEVLIEYKRRISTSELNMWMADIKERGYTITAGKKKLKTYYVTQTDVKPPAFVFFVNDKELVAENYKRFLENSLRDTFGFKGTALRLFFRNRS